MRCPTCSATVDADAHACPSCNAPTPRGRRAVHRAAARDRRFNSLVRLFETAGFKRSESGSFVVARWHAILVIVIVIPLVATGAYYVTKRVEIATDPNLEKPDWRAIAVVQGLPAGPEELTIGQHADVVLADLKTKNAVKEVEGWLATPAADGWVVTFAYEGQKERKEAQWKVDVVKQTAEPLNDWAKELGPKR